MLTETFTLLDGVEYDGKTHKVITMRIPLVKDSLEAEAESEGRSALHLSLALLSKHIQKIGDIPKEKITVDLLANLTDTDFERCHDVKEHLKKKTAWIVRSD